MQRHQHLLKVVWILGLTALSLRVASARIVMRRDSILAASDASCVLIVKQAEGEASVFLVEEVFLSEDGDPVQPGNRIVLPGFKLFTERQFGGDIIESITRDTRILLYLRRVPDKPGTWTAGYDFFWVHEPDKVEELRQMAQSSVSIRRQWDAARTAPLKLRVKAVWPYLEKHNGRFNRLAQKELQKLGPVAGDYLAAHLESMNIRVRETLLSDLAPYKSSKLHGALLVHLKKQQKLYESFVAKYGAKRGTKAVHLIDDWNSAPEQAKNIYGEIYYGLAGLREFKDRSDLPYVRLLGLWAARYHFWQACEEALHIFQFMPEKANLPIIEGIWNERRPLKRMDFMESDVTRALFSHPVPEAVPIAAQFINSTEMSGSIASSTHEFLKRVVGRDLGRQPEPWLAWYKSRHRAQR